MSAPSLYRLLQISILSLSVLLAACSRGGEPDRGRGESSSTGTQALLAPVDIRDTGVRLTWRILEAVDPLRRRVAIVVENPRGEPITSVRAWVRFDPQLSEVAELTIDPRFTLVAPEELTVVQGEGIVRLGAATPQPLRDQEISFASFLVTSRDPAEPGALSFYDWRDDGSGHTGVFAVVGKGKVRSLLGPPPSLMLP